MKSFTLFITVKTTTKLNLGHGDKVEVPVAVAVTSAFLKLPNYVARSVES